ncbi:MAG: hypothetical protein WC728_00795 [Elusimicrobiota bacterium]
MLRSPALAGVGSTLLAVLLLVAQASAGILAHSTFVLFVLPAGALAAGALCGCGLFLRLRLAGRRATWGHRLLAGSLGLLGFAATYSGMYAASVFDEAGERSRLESELGAVREKSSALRVEVRLTRERLAGGTAAPDVLKMEQEEGRARREKSRVERWHKAALDQYNLHVRSGKPDHARAKGLRADIARYESALAQAEADVQSWSRRLAAGKARQAARDKDLELVHESDALEAQSKELLEQIRAATVPSPQDYLMRCIAGRKMGLFTFVRLAPPSSKQELGDTRVGWLQVGLELLGFLAGSLLCVLLVGDGGDILPCPGCGKSLRVPSQPGLRVRCPSCGQEILLKG